jgi:hypothetical protein
MTVKTGYSIYIEQGSDLDKFIGKVKRKTTLSTEEILEFLINWSYEGYFFNNIDSLLDLFSNRMKDKK